MLPGMATPLLASGGPDPIALAYFASMTTQLDNAKKKAINEFVAGLRKDGSLLRIDRLYIYGLHDEQAAKRNLVKPGVGDATIYQDGGNPITFTANRGYAGSFTGSSAINTGLNDSDNVAGQKWGLSSQFIASYNSSPGYNPSVGTQNQSGLYTYDSYGSDPETGEDYSARTYTGYLRGHSGASFGKSLAYAPLAPSKYALSASRTGPTTQKTCLNSELSANYATAEQPATGSHIRGLLGSHGGRLALFAAGGGLTDAQLVSFNTRVTTLVTAIGAN